MPVAKAPSTSPLSTSWRHSAPEAQAGGTQPQNGGERRNGERSDDVLVQGPARGRRPLQERSTPKPIKRSSGK